MWEWLKKIRKQYLPYATLYIIYPLMRLVIWTCRFHVVGLDPYRKMARKGPTLLLLWHDRLAAIVPILRKLTPDLDYVGVVSDSRDGHLMAKLIRSFPRTTTIQVAHNARDKALREIIKHLKMGTSVMVMTPDGPRGPVHQAKEGAAAAALICEAQVVSFKWKANRYWQIASWDKMAFPKPFAHIEVTFGEPFLADKKKWTKETLTTFINQQL